MQQIGIILLMIHRGAKMVWCKGIWRSFVFLQGDPGNDTQNICINRELLDAYCLLNNHVQVHTLHNPWTDSLDKCARLHRLSRGSLEERQCCLYIIKPFLNLVCMSWHLEFPVPVLEHGATCMAEQQPDETLGGSMLRNLVTSAQEPSAFLQLGLISLGLCL